jgi:PAS domain S-box-containing protein
MKSALSTVLYVDDEEDNLEIFKGLLEDRYHILTETSTSRAVELLKKYDVKVILSDQRMPEESGLSFLNRIGPMFPDALKIIFTAFLDHDAALRAINQGNIYKYLLKPWNTKEIISTIDIAIREYDLRFENKKLLIELQKKNEELEAALTLVKENERKFYGIFVNSNDGIIIHRDRNILEANPALLKIIGLDEQTGGQFIKDHIHRKFPELLYKPESQLKKPETPMVEIDFFTETNEKRNIELNSCKIDFKDKPAILSIIRDITERKQGEKKIMEAIIRTQEEDQSRYARELHDGIGPILSTLKMYIEWLADASNVTNKEKISQQSILAINEAINLVKDIANNMSPHILQRFGLVNAIKTHLERVKETSPIEFSISSNVTGKLPDTIETSLYRVLLECINNSLKHAEAKKIFLKFKKQDGYLFISFSDNGKGFDFKEVMATKKGMGLFNIQNRIKLMGGDIRITSNIGIGTDIEFNLQLYGQ